MVVAQGGEGDALSVLVRLPSVADIAHQRFVHHRVQADVQTILPAVAEGFAIQSLVELCFAVGGQAAFVVMAAEVAGGDGNVGPLLVIARVVVEPHGQHPGRGVQLVTHVVHLQPACHCAFPPFVCRSLDCDCIIARPRFSGKYHISPIFLNKQL